MSFKSFIESIEKENYETMKSTFKVNYINERKDGKTALHFACELHNDILCVKFLLDKGADIEDKTLDNESQRPVHLAVRNGRVEVLKFLIDKGCRLDCLANGETPLNLAIARSLKPCRQLIENALEKQKFFKAVKDENYVKVETTCKEAYRSAWMEGKTALHYACELHQDTKCVNFLLDKGWNIEDKTNDKHTQRPVHLAVRKGNLQVLTLLIEKGCELNCFTKNGETPLALAKLLQQKSCLKLIEETIRKRSLSFMDAVKKEDHKTMTSTFRDSFVNEKIDGKTALHLACELHQNTNCVNFLLEKGWNIWAETNDEEKQRPVHLATRHGRVRVLQLLIEKGCDLNCVTSKGETPLDLAKSSQHRSCQKLIEEALEKQAEKLKERSKEIQVSEFINSPECKLIINNIETTLSEIIKLMKDPIFPDKNQAEKTLCDDKEVNKARNDSNKSKRNEGNEKLKISKLKPNK